MEWFVFLVIITPDEGEDNAPGGPMPAHSARGERRRRVDGAFLLVPADEDMRMTTPPGQSRLADGFHDVPSGRIATVVTHLEMTSPPPRQHPRVRAGWAMRHERALPPADYRALFRRVGEPWLWFSRLRMADEALASLLADPATHLMVLESEGEDAGLVELSFREPESCEVVFLGVIPDLIGSGAGRFMMSHALMEAWSRPAVARLTVHTCTLDHPGALAFYIRSGFRPVRQQVEIVEDPRLGGPLPPAAAPHVPLIRSLA